ncbi:MAG: UDP-N-acetylmuramoyl-tripeptide--D-alanyl-D-alanine ligase [Candidatus Liptonbacteria bacterium]|nr:UDP-N-acetylmuramoyl-tripeptide--D-alanyl-D-alanine ligase [Candidatus Liptonbacteria bacterium]
MLRWKLKTLARLTLWRFEPDIVGVTGSVGKTSAKLAIAAVLGAARRVRAAPGNLNNDLGLPVAILGEWGDAAARLVSREAPPGQPVRKAFFWFRVLCGGMAQFLFLPKKKYPEILVLEYGADKPGDIKELLSIARPSVSVITAIGEVPVHVEFYANPGEVAREKARLIESLPAAGFAVLNHDDPAVMALKDQTRAHVCTYGFGDGAEVALARFEHKVFEGKPLGISFKIEHGGSFVPVRLDNAFGRAHAYAAGAAASVGLIFGMNLVTISEALKRYVPAEGRMDLHAGVKESCVLDDSYNASPLSMRSALETLRDLPGTRRVAVLGDMLEIGSFAMQAHESAGRLAAKCADIIVTVGAHAKLIADAALHAGVPRDRIMSFDTAEDAANPVHNLIQKGDLVLVKGSHAMHLEEVVGEIKVG